MDTKKIWKETLAVIKISISSANFSTWFSQTFITSIKQIDSSRQITEIACPSSFIASNIQIRYFGLIQDSLNQATGLKNDITFIVKQQTQQPNKKAEQPLFAPDEIEIPGFDENTFREFLRKKRVRPGFTFDNFAVSSSNQMAWAASDAVSKNLGTSYNPLFLWGGVGLGKTHLMLAIADRALRQNPKLEVLYCMGEEFTTEIVEAIRTKTTHDFKKRYRNLKLLMLDDIQFIAGKNTVQEEFFHTFNTLLREGGQVVLTSDRPPSEIQKLEERLRSRFEAGLIIDISPPDFELRTAISLIKAQEKGISLSMEVAQAIAENIDNPRRIEGFLTRLLTETNEFQDKITLDLVYKILGKANSSQEKHISQIKAVLPQVFIDSVAQYYSLKKRHLLGNSRARPVSFPRQVLMYLLRTELGLPLEEVGHLVGDRDHTTVMHAVSKISTNLSTSSLLKNDILGIKKVISG